MIEQMFINLLHFITIFLIFLLSYGIAMNAILQPNPGDVQMFVSPIFKPYFHIMGEYMIQTPPNNYTTWFGTTIRNSYAEPICLVLLGVYLLIANVLLLNLVIAIFNSTYEKILGSSRELWKFHRYGIVLEYAYHRTVLFPPLSLIVHLFYMFRRWLKCCCGGYKRKGYKCLAKGMDKMKGEELQKLRELEGSCLIKLIRHRKADQG